MGKHIPHSDTILATKQNSSSISYTQSIFVFGRCFESQLIFPICAKELTTASISATGLPMDKMEIATETKPVKFSVEFNAFFTAGTA